MIKINKMLLIFIFLIFFLLNSASIIGQQENANNFNASEHRFFAQEFFGVFISIFILICFTIFIIPFIIGFLLSIWIYKDANKRGKEGIIWAIIFIILSLFSFIGLIIIIILFIFWLAIRPPIYSIKPKKIPPDRRCPNCGRVIPWEAKACPYCAKIFE